MKTEMNMNTNGVGRPAGARFSQGPEQRVVRPQLGIARALRASLAAGLILVAAGCATSNYDFDALTKESEHSRAGRLEEAMVLEKERGESGDLYDMKVAPLVHTHLNAFVRTEEEGIPKGFVEADIDAYLPLFGFVDATVNRYDNDHKMYESHEFDSYLWGLFQTHREQIATSVGLREKRTRRFLWLFSWGSSPKYVEGQV